MPRLNIIQQEVATSAATDNLMDYEYFLCTHREESKGKTDTESPMSYDMSQFHVMVAAFAGTKPISKGDFMLSEDHSSVGKTTQVATMQFVSLQQYITFHNGKRLFTDTQMTACEGNNNHDPVFSHDILPAPPHQYIGCATAANGLGQEPIVFMTPHAYLACHTSQADVVNVLDISLLESEYLGRQSKRSDLPKWDAQVLLTCARETEAKKELIVAIGKDLPRHDP